MATAATERLRNYLEAFHSFGAAQQPAWLRALRERGFARFAEAGFPTTRDEDWRFTNVSAIAQTPFQLARDLRSSGVYGETLDACRIPGAACQLVFVNGRFAAQLSELGNLPETVKVASLAQVITDSSKSVEAHLGSYLNIERDAFCALNTAFIEDGAYVYLPRGTVIEAPICFLFISLPGHEPEMTNPRNLVVAEDSTEASVVEDYVSLGSGISFSNAVTELVAGENAVISHYLIEREDRQAYNVSTLRTQQARSSNVSSHSVLLGGGLVRNNVHPVLAGEGGECLINGLFIGNGRQHIDNYMLVEHASPHCSSRQFYNGILDGRSHGVFHGRIIVHKDAQKTDAKQTNRNLLLSDDAQIDTKPQLEIYADDVKCTHGATIGQVEENALFYMRSRGIEESAARGLLLLAFANECLDRMKSTPVREYLHELVQGWLPGTSSRGRTDRDEAVERQEPGRRWEEVG
ncbi:MAG TPA: Fe-S cluster assembly protein SufD [Candidatus Acidoferrales bacterium]|nr:Fe-S cluster assembly protein SufD [Candidatus Acidoferrales bacterium]